MTAFLADVWPFLTGRSTNPIYRRDLARWSRAPLWRRAGWLLPVVIFSGAAALVGLPMAVILPVYLFPLYPWSSATIAGLVMLLIGQETIKQLTCLGAAALAGAAMAAELEDHTYELLRLAPITTRQIVLSKLTAALHPLRPLVVVSIMARLILILTLGWSRALFEMRASLNPALFSIRATMPPVVGNLVYGVSVWGYQIWELLARQVDAIQISSLWAVWLPYYLFQPAIDLALFTVTGLCAVSWARIRTGGLISAVGLGAALWIGGYLAERMAAIAASGLWLLSTGDRFFVTGFQWMPGIPAMDGSYIVVGGPFEVVLAGIILGKLALLWLLIRLASRRLAARYGVMQDSR